MATKIVTEDPSPPESPQPETVILTRPEWEEVLDCSIALHDALACFVEQGRGLELLQSVQKRLSQRVHRTANRLEGVRQSFAERCEDDDGIPPSDPKS